MTNSTIEITKEMFYRVIRGESGFLMPNTTETHNSYTDTIYRIDESMVFRRSQNGYANYYMTDFNA